MRKVGSMAGNLAGLKKGDVILVGNDRRYKIVKMVSFTEAKVRRTFGHQHRNVVGPDEEHRQVQPVGVRVQRAFLAAVFHAGRLQEFLGRFHQPAFARHRQACLSGFQTHRYILLN